ncbi:hypothetical protein OPIT5_20620 [Opitutaceae bacterium TAV5]|nr:hypothetical protein OPIT5_20620 [Opitutaceae bacterium TAV5]
MPVHRPQPPARRPARASRRGSDLLWRATGKDNRRAIGIGIAGTILFHLLLILLVPRLPWARWSPEPSSFDSSRMFDIEVEPDAVIEPPPEEQTPPRFVEVNPDAPDNPPDKAPNTGSQNQQVAQPEPSPETRPDADTPAVDGEKEDSTAIVSGSLTQPAPPAPPPPPPAPETPEPETVPDKPSAPDAAQVALDPLPGYENLQGPADNSPGTTSTPVPTRPGDADRQAEGTPDGAPTGTAAQGNGVPRIDRSRPMPRPRLPAATVVRARPSPILRNVIGTENIGAVAYDAKWSSYGEYLQRLVDTVQVQWERLIINSTVYPAAGTTVTVKFELNDKGEIARILDVKSNGSRPAEYSCVNAIQARSPYGDWTDDMKQVLGTTQEITFTFHYQ